MKQVILNQISCNFPPFQTLLHNIDPLPVNNYCNFHYPADMQLIWKCYKIIQIILHNSGKINVNTKHLTWVL